MRCTRLLVTILLSVLVSRDLVIGQTTRPTTAPTTTATAPTPSRYTPHIAAVRTDLPPKIDADLSDPCWATAAVIDEFKQIDPVTGAPPSERTEVRVCYDKDNLYVAVYCYDREPGKIIAKQRAREGDVSSDDVFTLTIDPFNDQRNGFWFEFSPAGAKRDATVENGSTVRTDWDGIWYLATRITDEGWFAEVAIPAKTISFNADAPSWGFNAGRTIRRKQEIIRWAGISRQSAVRNVGNAGRIDGITDLDQGLGLTVRPSGVGRVEIDEEQDVDLDLRPGLDVFYKITPATTLALTFNTDFAEADVDQRRVNLTRFPLFFPEKRAFFLQDAGIFSFGGITQTPLPFFSRRIGIVGGERKDILAGAKLTGREGPFNFGVLDVQMYPDDTLGNKNLAVVRGTVDVLEESNVGFIATRGDPSTPGENTVGGVDFNYRRNAPDGRIYEGTAWMQVSHNEPDADFGGPTGTDAAYGLEASYPNDDWSLTAGAQQIGDEFRPALGFVQRTGVRIYSIDARRRWRGVIGRRLDVGVGTDIYTDLDDRLESLDSDLPRFEIEMPSGDTFSAGVNYNREHLTDPFDITDDVTIPAGEYPFVRAYGQISTTDARPVATTLKFVGGEFYDGTREDYIAALELRPNASIYSSLEAEWNDVHLPGGDFLVRIFRFRFNILFTPELSWSNSLQYDNLSEAGSFNSRLRYEFEPGQELFFVVAQGFRNADDNWRSTGTELTAKVGLTLRF